MARCDPRLEFRPRIGRDLSGEIAHSMRQAALAARAREALLNRTDDAGRPVADHEQRIAEPSGAQVLKGFVTSALACWALVGALAKGHEEDPLCGISVPA